MNSLPLDKTCLFSTPKIRPIEGPVISPSRIAILISYYTLECAFIGAKKSFYEHVLLHELQSRLQLAILLSPLTSIHYNLKSKNKKTI